MNIKYIYSLILIFSSIIWGTTACKRKGCTDSTATNYDAKAKLDDQSCLYDHNIDGYHILFQFSHNYEGINVSEADFDQLSYTNSAGNMHSLLKLRYLVSDIYLYKTGGDSLLINGYKLIDLSNPNSFSWATTEHIPTGDYTGIGFTFGLSESDNISGQYTDLNAASWSWPESLGGGYHYMQLEGKFIDNNTDTISFAYHMGKARQINSTDTIFHNNDFKVQLPNSGFSLSNDASIEIKMNLAEWFKNPNTWDLNTYNSLLMPNYSAQVMMNKNGQSVFSIGTISQ